MAKGANIKYKQAKPKTNIPEQLIKLKTNLQKIYNILREN